MQNENMPNQKAHPTEVEDYLCAVAPDKHTAFRELFQTVQQHIPDGFRCCMNYGMIGWVVPKNRYPKGYHCDPSLPLPFLNLAAQKNYIALYHSALYADPLLTEWFVERYPKHSKYKLDMGKSCVRFKRTNDIPHVLVAELLAKFSVDEWIVLYEKSLLK